MNKLILEEKKTGGWPVRVMFITPVKRRSLQGRGSYFFINSQGDMVEMERNFAKGVAKRYNFPPSRDGRTIRTMLNRQVINKWYDLDPNNLPGHLRVSTKWQDKMDKIVQREEIPKQLELEIRFDLEPGTLTNEKSLSSSFRRRDKGQKGTYLETFFIELYDRPNRFEDSTIRGALALELAISSGKIADSKQEVNPSRHDFYISSENEDTMEKVAKQEIINNAITDLTLLRRQQTAFLRYKIAIVLDQVKGTVAEAIVKNSLNKFIVDKSKDQIGNIKKFRETVDLISQGQEGLDKLHIKYCIKQALNVKLMSVNGGHYLWHSKKGIENLYDLGSKYESVVKLFLDEYLKYDPEDTHENHYGELMKELKYKGVRIEE